MFAYHFATVVARSAADYITMENYARGEREDLISAGDPLFFFRMYGTQLDGQTWHDKQLASGNFRGAIFSFQVHSWLAPTTSTGRRTCAPPGCKRQHLSPEQRRPTWPMWAYRRWLDGSEHSADALSV